ncbi:uncharacterized protein LOC123665367 [Melitaea cinxia]|uniref:uncharacterized protein LOC123665367 n=1 Tax=Melitaea cinxia TaxID=113334 RepID=UPI001E26F8DB|nr:uncharacterized protein LOC123665367 [Melitaea cinxia]
MNWVVIASFIVCLATFSKGNALRGTSESKDAAPPKDEEPIELRKTSIISEISETSEAQCLAGSEWTSNCHSCRCSKEGVAKCTRLESCEGRYAEPITCKPQTKFLRDCNMCMCLENGKSLCTLRLCIKVDSKTPISDKHDENKSDLNYDFDDHKVLKRSSICKPNALIKTDCNFCKCASDGQSYSCTLNVCEEPDINDDVEVFKENEDSEHDGDQVDGKVCKPRATFHIGCNTCHCNFDGTTFTCTNKPCPLPDDVELFHELRVLRSSPDKKSVVCAANRMFIKDCNTCWCNEDGTSYYCTRKVCVTDAPDILEEAVEEVKRKCIPDEVFELDCNTCRCSQDGMSFSCTRKACIPEEKGKNVSLNRRIRATSQGTPKTCTPGQEFRMDCNKCLCNDEGQDFSCTRIDCTAINNNGNVGVRAKRDVTTQIQLECAPGSVFKQGCNLCHCTEDGKHATCALKRCTEKDTQEESLVPESDPSFRCNPGEQTKRGCNDCSCSADGKSVFCTLRFCDQDITPTI